MDPFLGGRPIWLSTLMEPISQMRSLPPSMSIGSTDDVTLSTRQLAPIDLPQGHEAAAKFIGETKLPFDRADRSAPNRTGVHRRPVHR
jgi:hypothetical protein